MHNRVFSSGFVSAIVALIVGAVFGTYGAWGLLITQAENTAGRWVIAIAVSVFFAWVYSYFRGNFFVASTAAFRGVVFGLSIWLLSIIIATLVEEVRVFAFRVPVGATLFLTAMMFAIWGAVLAIIYETGISTRVDRERGTPARARR